MVGYEVHSCHAVDTRADLLLKDVVRLLNQNLDEELKERIEHTMTKLNLRNQLT